MVEFEYRQAETYGRAAFWVGLTFPWPFNLSLLLHVVLEFTQYFHRVKKRWIVAALYAPAAAFSAIELLTDWITRGVIKKWGYALDSGTPHM